MVEFSVKNAGKHPVTIKRVETDCGCTTARATSQVVAAGKSSAIVVKFNKQHRYGMVEHIIVVYSDDPERPVKFLHLKVTCDRD